MGNLYGNPRRPLDWAVVRTPPGFLATLVATFGGAGLLPRAPGTFGSIAAVPLAFALGNVWGMGLGAQLAFWAGVTVVGTWAARFLDETMGSADNQNIVIDEVIGIGVTGLTAGASWLNWAVVLVVFRVFDIVKFPPVRQVDDWSKHQSSAWQRGFGVLADDILAGVQGLVVIVFLQAMGWLPGGVFQWP